jgi:hypothetical protein
VPSAQEESPLSPQADRQFPPSLTPFFHPKAAERRARQATRYPQERCESSHRLKLPRSSINGVGIFTFGRSISGVVAASCFWRQRRASLREASSFVLSQPSHSSCSSPKAPPGCRMSCTLRCAVAVVGESRRTGTAVRM